MLLGSFQVDQEFEWRHTKFSELSQHFGYYPRFCFKADTPQDVIRNGLIASPNSVDNFFIFETDNYEYLNTVNWNRYIITKDDADFKKSIQECDPYRSEYLVQYLTNIKYQLRPQKWMPKGPDYSSSFETVKSWISQIGACSSIVNRFCDFMITEENHFVREFVLLTLEKVFKDNYSSLIASISIFKMDYLFFHYGFNTALIDIRRDQLDIEQLEERIHTIPVFDWKKYFDLDVRSLLYELCNANTGLDGKTDYTYDQIVQQINSCLSIYADFE